MKSGKYFLCVLIYTQIFCLAWLCWFTFSQNKDTTSRKIHSNRIKNPISLCNDKSSNEGFHQKVISFSLFDKKGVINEYFLKRYQSGIKRIHQEIKQFYPGWLMRIYTNNMSLLKMEGLKSYFDKNENDLYICDITTIKSTLGNLSIIDGTMWRFLPMFDPTVDIFICRDIDSSIGERERSAVKQWEVSSYAFHAMRDHSKHSMPIMSGMWGGKNDLIDLNMISTIKNGILLQNKKFHYGIDQDVLKLFLYGPFKSYIMQHDSYHCKKFSGSIPFPEKRPNNHSCVGLTYRGHGNPGKIMDPCPIACRPDYGKNWMYC